MDERSFAELTKRVAQAGTRRRALRTLAAGVTAAAIGTRMSRPIAAAETGDEAFGFCRPPLDDCHNDQQCCAGKCLSTGVCGCNNKGKACINRVGIACCSQKCRKGKCK